MTQHLSAVQPSAAPPPPPPPPPFASSPQRASDAHSSADADPTPAESHPCIVTIRAWVDPLVDEHGHDPRSAYVETFWLGVLGPTATWLLRRLACGLETEPDGFQLDLGVTAAGMGLSFGSGRSSAFTKAMQRCVMFGLAHQLPDGGLAVRRRIPTVAHRHLRRMPPELQRQHADWESHDVTLDDFTRAHQLALTMVEVGDDAQIVEHQLRALGVSTVVAAQVAENVARLVVD